MARKFKRFDKDITNAKICLFGDLSSIHLKRWATALKDMGCDVSVISYRKATLESVKVYDISCSDMRGKPRYEKYLRLLRGIKMVFLLRRALRQIKPDIFHVHYLINTPLSFAFWGLDNLVLSPWGNDIIYDHGHEPWSVVLYKKRLLRWAKEITALSRFLGQHVQKYMKRSLVVIPFGVETSIFVRKRRTRQNFITISFVKHLKTKYGPRYLIEALSLIIRQHKKVVLNIAGRGPEEQYLRNLAESLKVASRVKFLGAVPHDQVVSLLNETDIFVMPSVYESETFGVAAIEASSMEIPVVASDLGGIREAVLNGETGLLVPPGNAQAIADACLLLIKDSLLRKKLGKQGREYVQRTYEWRHCVERMMGVYRQILVNDK
jgi:glycosyltransferase involved in cell wall biosynthesis